MGSTYYVLEDGSVTNNVSDLKYTEHGVSAVFEIDMNILEHQAISKDRLRSLLNDIAFFGKQAPPWIKQSE